MLHVETLRASADELMSAALLGDGWESALEHLSRAAGARGAILMRHHGLRMVASLGTPEVRDVLSKFIGGLAPPSSRETRTIQSQQLGFNRDHDDYSDDELARDPYYQEFLRPNGFFWHSNATLDGSGPEYVTLSFKRSSQLEPYRREDTDCLNAILPQLRAAARIARGVLDASASGMARALHMRGGPVLELDAWGRVLRTHGLDSQENGPVRIARNLVLAVRREEQTGIERAIATALHVPPRPSAAVLSDARGERYCLQLIPVAGRARDIFLAAAAVGVLIALPSRPSPTPLQRAMVRDAFALTGRESDIAVLIASGLSPTETARDLRVGLGTVRHHLKSVFDKTGTHRQAEIAALVARLAP